jgi:hypothetical protein
MRPFKHVLIAFAASVGLTLAGSAQAQPVTGTPTLSNIPPTMTALYPDWSTAVISDPATGFEVNAGDTGGGAGYYTIPTPNLQTLNTSDTEAVLTVTINDGNNQNTMWVGMGFYLNDNSGANEVGGYVGEFGYYGQFSPGSATWNAAGTTVTETVNLPAAMIAAIQAGGDTIYGITLEYYPAVYNGSTYDVTFNSLVLQPAIVPAPQITSSQYNAAAGQFTLTWSSQPSAQYTVQVSTNLAAGFTPLVTNIASGGTTTTTTVTVPAGNAAFFRIVQQ